MKIELLGALDYARLEELLREQVENSGELIKEIKNLEDVQRANIIAAAGRLSRFPGNVFESLGISEENDYEKNIKLITRIAGMGHDSITDHAYCVFAIKDVSPVIEQTIIEERFSSFTTKSRREVDFGNVGFFTPKFHDEKGVLLKNNEEVSKEYQEYMNSLFKKYAEFVDLGVPKEDARFVLPYCYHSNIIMGVDAHTLKDMIVKYTKTKYANIEEIREFGEKLKAIANEHFPFLNSIIESEDSKAEDPVESYLDNFISDKSYQILDQPKLIKATPNIDDTILISAIMRRYQFDYDHALKIYKDLSEQNPEFKQQLMQKIAFEGDKLELTQVNFEFQIPLSLAVLTHLTRHRTHHLMTPDFVPVVDLSKYKVPPKIANTCKEMFDEVFAKNIEMYNHFKNDYNIRPEDLIYFTLSGNMVNVITNLDGKTIKHILGLRECTKAQWETRDMAYGIHKEIDKLDDVKLYSSILGATCTTQGFCKEGKESCGRILKLKERRNK